MATYSSILAWEIPRTEEPGRIQSMGWPKSWPQLSDQTTKFHWNVFYDTQNTCFLGNKNSNPVVFMCLHCRLNISVANRFVKNVFLTGIPHPFPEVVWEHPNPCMGSPHTKLYIKDLQTFSVWPPL